MYLVTMITNGNEAPNLLEMTLLKCHARHIQRQQKGVCSHPNSYNSLHHCWDCDQLKDYNLICPNKCFYLYSFEGIYKNL